MIQVRLAQIKDVAALQHLNQEVFIDNQQYDDDLVMDWAPSEKGKEYFTQLLQNSNTCCFIAEKDSKKVGYIAASPKTISYRKSKYLEIDNMGVIPEYRSQGVGKMLIQKCLTWAKSKGYQKLYVNAYIKNVQAISFYKKNEFKEIDISLERNI